MDLQPVLFDLAPMQSTLFVGYSPAGDVLQLVEVRCVNPDGSLRCYESAGTDTREASHRLIEWGTRIWAQHVAEHCGPFA